MELKPCSEIAKEIVSHFSNENYQKDRWLSGNPDRLKEQIYEVLQTERTAREKVEAALEAWKSMTYCAYCGFESPLDVDTSLISEHIRTCEKHPIREYENQITALRSKVEELREVIRDIASNYDCDRDAHKYGTVCRRCSALAALTADKPENGGGR